jgi:hypothetical protein
MNFGGNTIIQTIAVKSQLLRAPGKEKYTLSTSIFHEGPP